ncbi:response regulator transcription factor [Paenibacillus sp. FSL H8-0034]|uniref:response regulator transcription factor n=1 Tax=Paenibacillus sp. FSL H8-0034 TaxID=2954671 RepID=UPI0030F54F44
MRIVLIDDEDVIRKGMIYLLEQLDMDITVVAEARNGQDGLNKIELLQPDYAFIDIRMPVMDGLQLVQELHERKISPKTKSVIITAHSEFEFAQKAVRYGVSDFLLKPLDEEVLLDLFLRLGALKQAEPVITATIGVDLIRQIISRKQVTNPVIIEMMLYIGKNYMKSLKLSDLADAFHVTPSYISSLFKKTLDENFVNFLNDIRIELSKRLLEQGQYKINEIAFMVGYNNITYFDRVFKTRTSMTPNEYMSSWMRER